MLEIKLEKNSTAAYFHNDKNSKEEDFKIMTPRNQKFLIKRISMFAENGLKTIKVDIHTFNDD